MKGGAGVLLNVGGGLRWGCLRLQISKLNKAKHSLGQISDAVKMRHFALLYFSQWRETYSKSEDDSPRSQYHHKDAENIGRIEVYLLLLTSSPTTEILY